MQQHWHSGTMSLLSETAWCWEDLPLHSVKQNSSQRCEFRSRNASEFKPLNDLVCAKDHTRRKQIALQWHFTKWLFLSLFTLFSGLQWWLGVFSSPVQLWTRYPLSAKGESPALRDIDCHTYHHKLFCVKSIRIAAWGNGKSQRPSLSAQPVLSPTMAAQFCKSQEKKTHAHSGSKQLQSH